ncbi:MAG: prepilin-type N-terminal cleavage/methylation domain-containing protein [Gammaproteobacteria bacterium]|nr:prepilin-type N-terminal cleavage/methylation domain-containing protein [Gammaproteobacteria bacterium]
MPKAVKATTPTSGSNRPPAAATRGFSLLELLVVLLLLVAAVAIVPPFFSKGLSSGEFRQGVRLVAAGLRKTQSLALSSHREQVFSLNLEARTFTAGNNAAITELPVTLDLKLKTAASERSGDQVGAIRFFPDGSSTGGSVTLSSGSRVLRVAVNWMTGSIVTEEVR